jgi:Homeodomain-like domain
MIAPGGPCASPTQRVARRSLRAELEQLLGEAATLALIEELGGGRVYVPQRPQPEDRLSRLVGFEAAQKLGRMYGGERLELPNPPLRRRKILDLRRRGASVEGIARELGCTRRRVFQVLAEERGAARARAEPTPSNAAPRLSNH